MQRNRNQTVCRWINASFMWVAFCIAQQQTDCFALHFLLDDTIANSIKPVYQPSWICEITQKSCQYVITCTFISLYYFIVVVTNKTIKQTIFKNILYKNSCKNFHMYEFYIFGKLASWSNWMFYCYCCMLPVPDSIARFISKQQDAQ